MNDELKALLERWPLAHEFNLPRNSLVVVAGAYKGITMQLLSEMYSGIIVHGFEPQLWAAVEAQKRLESYPECYIHDYAIGTEDDYKSMGEYNTDACSFVNIGPGSREQGYGQMYKIDTVFNMLHFNEIELFVMNMEGYEFELLPYMERSQPCMIDQIRKLAIQFHSGLGNDFKYDNIIEMLDNHKYRAVDQLPAWGYWKDERHDA